MQAAIQTKTELRAPVRCHHCGKVIFDGDVVKSRVLKVLTQGAQAKCQCKTWVSLPLIYEAGRAE